MSFSLPARLLCACVLVFVLQAPAATVQSIPGIKPSPVPAQPEAPKDTLGRTTPRGTVLGFLAAARKGDNGLARYYLDTPQGGTDAETLAHQLFVVLDARLPARLAELSDAPEGSRANPLTPDLEVVGTVRGTTNVEIVLRRKTTPNDGTIWLFSRPTLGAIPGLYEEVTAGGGLPFLPQGLVNRRVGGVRVFEWLAAFLALPLFYLATLLLDRVLTPIMAPVWGRVMRASGIPLHNAIPAPARLLLLALSAQWLFSRLHLSLLVRQFLSSVTAVVEFGAIAWLLLRLNSVVAEQVEMRVPRAHLPGGRSLLHAARAVVNVLVVLVASLAALRHFGVDLTPVLAGLGVGGIAVALAAQKTLENMIAGASLILDDAVRDGDYLKIGDIEGTVEHVGLRSTRIRTLDRSLVSVPNSQIANMSVETLSARDKFWFHPTVGLRYETTADQLQAVLDGLRELLARHPAVDAASVRIRFLRLGAFSLDVEMSAYVFARDWPHFLEVQERLLFDVTEIVRLAGTSIAFPSQTMYVQGAGRLPF